MITRKHVLPAVVVSGSSIVVACGGGNSNCSSYGSSGSYAVCNNPVNADPAGVYEGTLTDPATQKETPVFAIIAENGDGRVSGTDGTYYRINVGTNAASLNGSYVAYSQGAPLANGGLTDSGSVSGSVTQTGLSIALNDPQHNATDGTLNFYSAYTLPSSLPTLAGTWSYNATSGFSLQLTIHASGMFSGTDSNNCTYSGSFGLIDSRVNAYSENYTRSCSGVADTFSGLSTFVPAAGSGSTATPAQIQLLADDDAGGFLSVDLSEASGS